VYFTVIAQVFARFAVSRFDLFFILADPTEARCC
jgi:hypothetical protein